ncbi:MAG TPA: histidine phosphatase family protein [Janthinobacterium sp.]|nr:histidine phosphatase family protein [Janthinobacterium sp.]
MGQIYLVRHGQASFGSADYDQLSDLGVEQARLLGQWFANCRQGFDRVVTGGMRRHRQSADACLGQLPKSLLRETEWQSDAGFAEFDHHEVLLRQRPDFADAAVLRALGAGAEGPRAFERVFLDAMARWMDGGHDADYEEPWPLFRLRCVAALERLVAAAAGDVHPSIVFTSGGTIAALCQHLMGLPNGRMAELNWTLVNSAVTKLFYGQGKLGVGYLNNFAHLEWLGEANAITYR